MAMTTINDTYRTTVKAVAAAKQGALSAADMAAQGAISAATHDIGYIEGTATGYAAFNAAQKAAASARLAAIQTALMNQQAAIENAKNIARDAGEKLTQ